MAKLQGPLLSVGAHGTVGGVLTFSERKTVDQVRFQRKQQVFSSEALLIERDKFYASGVLWNFLTQEEKDQWTDIAKQGWTEE